MRRSITMSERELFPDNPASKGIHNGSTPDNVLPPQPVPRAGMGIADRLGIVAPVEADSELQSNELNERSRVAVIDATLDDTSDLSSRELAGEHLAESEGILEKDARLIPELAPLAVQITPDNSPMISSRPLDEITLDEFDSATAKAYSGQRVEYSGGDGGDGGNKGGELDNYDDGDTPGSMAQDLFSHLAELRSRILYSVIAVAVASAVTWNYGKWIQAFLAAPIIKTLKASGLKDAQLITIDPTEGFYLYFQITLSAAILLAAPIILYQMWRFIEPALTRTERRYTVFLVPFSVILFFSGVALGYFLSPLFFSFFLQFQPAESVATFSYGASVALLAKMLLVFGVCFQVPVVTIFLNKVGVISRNFLIEYWRHAVILIFTIVAVITPTWDPLTLCACATPPCLLYVLSIWLVKWL